jgi:hypothetical protein
MDRSLHFGRTLPTLAALTLILLTGMNACTTTPANDARAANETYQAAIAIDPADQDRRMDAARHPAVPFTQAKPE